MDYVNLAGKERCGSFTDEGSKDDHSPLWGRGHNLLESFGFWRRKFCIKNAEILSVGKIAEFAKFAGGKRRKSLDRFLFKSSDSELSKRRGRKPSDTALPIRASLLAACPAEVLTGL